MSQMQPIIDYEGSDYQVEFWEEGGRAYEDAAEAAALKRLLPHGGKFLLELGAGAGRNTPRYQGFEKIVLVDYSRTQLQLALERLGKNQQYIYVAADIYRLPFVNGLFEAATMIRTLHHMADARLALDQVRRVLESKAIFILEFANKRNIKAILRYMLRRQLWNPFSPEPVEFAPLNFDFHPATVRAWLRACGFSIERQLTVSHFRVELLKKILPLRFLVWLDWLMQPTGAWWQFTPSIFIRSHATGATALAGEGAFFRCPVCENNLVEEVSDSITCSSCGRIYPIVNGIYDFRLAEEK